MKKSFLTCGLITLFAAFSASGQVWRLNNQPGVSADFTTTLQDAIDGISPGDTIYVEPTPFSYGPATISKKVILIGAGYWHEENEETQASYGNSIIEELVFEPGSEGSEITGLYFYKIVPTRESWCLITINTNNIAVRRNYLKGQLNSCYMGGCNGVVVLLNGDRTNIHIEKNWLECLHDIGPAGTIGAAIHINGVSSDIYIRNNFIKSNMYALYEDISYPELGVIFSNNVIWGNIHVYNALVVNNILLSGNYYDGASSLASNNICNGQQFPAINNNQINVDMSTVFINHTGYIDNGYLLEAGSPAIGAGFNGGDCGVFSYDFGGSPYVLSGMPAIPAIYEFNINSTVYPVGDIGVLEVNIKSKSNN